MADERSHTIRGEKGGLSLLIQPPITGYPLLISPNTPTMTNKLKINHFKELYKSLKTPFPPINFLILGMLIGLENRWINLKTKQTVDMAIDEYHDKMDELSEPVYKAVIKEVEDGYTIGYFPEDKDETVS